MRRKASAFLALIGTVWAAGIVAQTDGERRTDPLGLASYVLPDGWQTEGIGNGTHFTRAGWPDDKSILKIDAELVERTTLADLARGRSIVHEAQAHAEESSRRYRLNGFDAWEGVYRATLRGDEVVFHDVLLMSTGALIDISLTTYADRYADDVSELAELLGSIEATGRDETAAAP